MSDAVILMISVNALLPVICPIVFLKLLFYSFRRKKILEGAAPWNNKVWKACCSEKCRRLLQILFRLNVHRSCYLLNQNKKRETVVLLFTTEKFTYSLLLCISV